MIWICTYGNFRKPCKNRGNQLIFAFIRQKKGGLIIMCYILVKWSQTRGATEGKFVYIFVRDIIFIFSVFIQLSFDKFFQTFCLLRMKFQFWSIVRVSDFTPLPIALWVIKCGWAIPNPAHPAPKPLSNSICKDLIKGHVFEEF